MTRMIWERKHKISGEKFNRVTLFASEIYEKHLQGKSGKLLDLGCGKGADSIFFHSKGFDVTAVDFSKFAILKFNEQQQKDKVFITTLMRDFTEPFIFADGSFDVVYSRISLNYFTDEVTRNIFREIDRVLKSEGMLIFQTKSTKDKDYGMGKKIEENVFEKEEGYARHFFSLEYVEVLLPGYSLVQKDELVLGNGNAYLNVVAVKK
jgi:SAM-dependent methyltransferase